MGVFKRLRWYLHAQSRARRFGIHFVRRRYFDVPASIKVAEKRVLIVCRDEHGMRADFINVFLDDTYRLETVAAFDKKVRVIVDIGGNAGWFTLAARSYFPDASIDIYEPNSALQDVLATNTRSIGATHHIAAVGGRRELVALEVGNESNLGRTVIGGAIPQETLQDVLGRVGGHIDLLKLDCEGAEWAIFDSSTDWGAIRWITMEYHLWARPGSDHSTPVKLLESLGFRVLEQARDSQWGTLLAASRRWLEM